MVLYWILIALSAQLEILLCGWYTGIWVSVPMGTAGIYYNWVAGRVEVVVWYGWDRVQFWSAVIVG
jgi:hypothetical protein